MNELDLFAAAIAVADPAQRAALLDQHCAGQPRLRQRLDQLLDAHFRSQPLLDQPQPVPTSAYGDPQAAPAVPPSVAETAGAVIAGKYTLAELIGEGGMGAVWRGRQTEPVKRPVAVKLIKAGMDSRQVLTRFEAERQALALMDHPNIARVLDGGLHQGRPFFVMELVKGVPITEYCDARKLTPKERLELFVPVCQAIQHAHQKGIIHRDIKPSNVLVALYDDRPVPKVIDFGVAKATGGALTEHTLETGFGGVVGTPQYMSPEQATFNNLDIDTRSDVYALGVLLYELLTGSPPFATKELQKKGFLEILRVVREEEPPRPSAKLSTADALPTLSAKRGTEPRKLTSLLRNELDWVVMKALEKDRTRRYETANGFAADVLRYLGGEAVQAHPPSTAYRLKKFVKRYQGQVIAAALVLLALVAGVIGTTCGMVAANRAAEAERNARNDAVEQKRLAEEAAENERRAKVEAEGKRREAEQNLAFARKGNEILGSVFASLNPKQIAESGRPLQDVLRENLGKAVKELEGSALGDPVEVAAMQVTLGRSLVVLGEYALAVEVLAKALKTVQAKLGPEHPVTLVYMNDLSHAYVYAGRLDRALPLLKEVLRLEKARVGPEHPDTFAIMNNLGHAYLTAGKWDLALPLFKETLKLCKAKLGPEHPDTLNTMNNLAMAYQAAGNLGRALPLLEETLDLMKARLGPEHPYTLATLNNFALAYQSAGMPDKALPLFEEALKLVQARLGPDHPHTRTTMSNLEIVRRLVAADERYRPLDVADKRYRAKLSELGPKHIDTLLARRDLAQMQMTAGQLDAAEPSLVEVLQGLKDSPPTDPIVVFTTGLLRVCLTLRQRKAPDDWKTFNTLSLLGGALLGQKKYAEAEPLLLKGHEGLQQREKTMPPQATARIPEALDRLIELYTATNKPDQARKWRAERAKYPEAQKPVAPEKK